jgi:hypothetical protein
MNAVRDSEDKDLNKSLQILLLAARELAQSTGPDSWHEKRDHVMEEQKAYVTERQEINRRQKEAKKSKKAVRKTKLVAEGHWSSTKSGRRAF